MSYEFVESNRQATPARPRNASRWCLRLAAVALLSGPPLLAGDAMAEDSIADGDYAGPLPTQGMTEYEVRQRVYGYLGRLGYSRAIGPGGASIQDLDPVAGGWLATVRLRGASAVQTRQTRLFVDARRGRVSVADRQRREAYAAAP